MNSKGNVTKNNKFLRMAEFIGSKTHNQCKSHHQQMMKTFCTVENII
jgi:hypothetical protein